LGAGDSHARHDDLSFELVTQQTEHVQESVGVLNLSPNPEITGADSVTATTMGTTSRLFPLKTSRALPDLNSDSAGSIDSFSGVFFLRGLTSNGELKLKLTAASNSYGLTVTKGAEKVKAGRGTEVLVIDELTNPLELDTAAVFTEDDTTVSLATTWQGGSKLKLGKPAIPIGIGTAVSSSESTSSSSRIRGAD
jgi:hypothetical protein